jgi:flagellar basal-body rod modification protein FlgD
MAAIASALPSHVAAAAPAPAPKTAASSSGSSSSNNSTAGDLAASDSLANEQTFLQLLVAQLQKQDPTDPMDGTQFVTQLAQFSQLEQDLAMRQDLDKIAGSITTTPVGGSTGNNDSSS